MLLLICSVFILLSSVQGSPSTSFAVSPSTSKAVCHEGETACDNSCCPFPNAVCCNETQTCCRQGSVCLGSIPYCLGMKENEVTPTLYSESSTALRGAGCPSGTTTCSGGCCPLPNAVCCPDGLTCCPEGTMCDPSGTGICMTGRDVANRFLKVVLRKSLDVPSHDTYNNFHPNRRMIAPKAGDDCCDAWFGHICCQFPFVCTTMGCM